MGSIFISFRGKWIKISKGRGERCLFKDLEKVLPDRGCSCVDIRKDERAKQLKACGDVDEGKGLFLESGKWKIC
jgi:hypothetical protein